MARKYEYAEGKLGWSLDAHEERWFIARYAAIETRIPTDQRWKNEFENYFFNNGAGIGEIFLTQINQHCARLGQPPITFRETNIGDYARNPDRPFKAQSRSEWREEWLTINPAERQRLMREWEMMMAESEPAHRTFEEFKGLRSTDIRSSDNLSEERTRRQTAYHASARVIEEQAGQQADAAQRERVARLIRQLKMAATLPDAEQLLSALMARVLPAEALDLAETIEDVAIKTSLLKRSMEE